MQTVSRQAHVTLSGDIAGEYVVVERGSDGGLTLAPDTSVEAGPTVEEWGDLDAQMDAVMSGSLRELDEEERKDGFPPWRP